MRVHVARTNLLLCTLLAVILLPLLPPPVVLPAPAISAGFRALFAAAPVTPVCTLLVLKAVCLKHAAHDSLRTGRTLDLIHCNHAMPLQNLQACEESSCEKPTARATVSEFCRKMNQLFPIRVFSNMLGNTCASFLSIFPFLLSGPCCAARRTLSIPLDRVPLPS